MNYDLLISELDDAIAKPSVNYKFVGYKFTIDRLEQSRSRRQRIAVVLQFAPVVGEGVVMPAKLDLPSFGLTSIDIGGVAWQPNGNGQHLEGTRTYEIESVG